MMKKPIKEEVDDLDALFFYTSAIPFSCIENYVFAKMCDAIGKYGIGYKPPSYHDIRGKLLKRAVHETEKMLKILRMKALSQKTLQDETYILNSLNSCFNHNNSDVVEAKALYSASADDLYTIACFLDLQATKDSPMKPAETCC
ncbi:hypothetical protein KIW84_063911 [Lathyrus oleraceus]|uniref:Uncharacterized protein n=1 Tax=Pisum sativum TaxID=3888 RepID=A0A9D4WCI5_PEA|nr:hypothetical protein KIW84_063911 [Pisum sativum]